MRIINFKCLKHHVNMSELYISANILKFNDIFQLEVAKFMYSFYTKHLPENFANYLSSVSTHHNYATRSVFKKNYFIPRVNTQCGQSACT